MGCGNGGRGLRCGGCWSECDIVGGVELDILSIEEIVEISSGNVAIETETNVLVKILDGERVLGCCAGGGEKRGRD